MKTASDPHVVAGKEMAPAAVDSGSSGGRNAARRSSWMTKALPWVTTIALIAIEEILSRTGALPQEIPPFTTVLQTAFGLVPTGGFMASLGSTMAQFALGLAIGAAIGVAAGAAFGGIPVLYRLTHYVMDFLRFIPSVVYIPILLLVLGATPDMVVFLTALGSIWPMLYQTYYGVVGIAPVLQDTARVFGLKPHQRFVNILLPAVSPFMATGLRIAASHALVVVVAVQIITAVKGIGRDISVYATNGVYPEMYALVGIVGVIGLLLNVILEELERRLLHWHPSYREKAK